MWTCTFTKKFPIPITLFPRETGRVQCHGILQHRRNLHLLLLLEDISNRSNSLAPARDGSQFHEFVPNLRSVRYFTVISPIFTSAISFPVHVPAPNRTFHGKHRKSHASISVKLDVHNLRQCIHGLRYGIYVLRELRAFTEVVPPSTPTATPTPTTLELLEQPRRAHGTCDKLFIALGNAPRDEGAREEEGGGWRGRGSRAPPPRIPQIAGMSRVACPGDKHAILPKERLRRVTGTKRKGWKVWGCLENWGSKSKPVSVNTDKGNIINLMAPRSRDFDM